MRPSSIFLSANTLRKSSLLLSFLIFWSRLEDLFMNRMNSGLSMIAFSNVLFSFNASELIVF